MVQFKTFKKEDIARCIEVCNPSLFADGWEIFKVYNEDYWGVKVRKPYDEDEIDFNECGYKYKMIYVSLGNTEYYMFFKRLGYFKENKTRFCTPNSNDIKSIVSLMNEISIERKVLNNRIREHYEPLISGAAKSGDVSEYNRLIDELPDCPFKATAYRIGAMYNID